MQKLVVSIDGPSASGKGLIGSMIAKKFSLKYFQSSLVYRGLAYICMQHDLLPSQVEEIIKIAKKVDILELVEGVDLNKEKIGEFTSKIAVIPEVRELATNMLRDIIQKNPRIIMEGRDIGSVVAPDADLKIFITASIKVRAERRYKQLCSEGKSCMLNDIFNLMQERDTRDKSREQAPLVVPEDAIMLDTTDLTPEKIIEKIEYSIINHKNANDLFKMFNLKAEIRH